MKNFFFLPPPPQDHKDKCLKTQNNEIDAETKPTCYTCKIEEEEMLLYVSK